MGGWARLPWRKGSLRAAVTVIVASCLLAAVLAPTASAAREREGRAQRTPREQRARADGPRCRAVVQERATAARLDIPAVIDALRHPPSIEDLETRYDLRVDLRYRPPRLRVRERIQVCNRSDRPLHAVHLSVLSRAFEEMRVRDVRVAGRRVTDASPDRSVLIVPLRTALARDEGTVIELTFTLEPTRALRSSLHESLSQGLGILRVSDWFALVSNGHRLRLPGDSQVSAAAARITLDLRLDRQLDVAAPGTVVRQSPRRHVYTIRHARDYAFVVAPRLTTLRARTSDGVRVEVRTTRTGQAEEALRSATRALERYGEVYGPYPWRRFVVAPTTSLLGGDEYPGIALIGLAWLRGPYPWELRALRRGRPDRWFGVRYVVSHEVAHQWFYALVGSDQLREPWLDEGLAEFAAHHHFRPDLLTSCAVKPVSSAVTDFRDRRSARGCLGYTETVYRGGAVLVDRVRRLLGDEAFSEAMRDYVDAQRFAIATADDLLGAWRAHAWSPMLLEAILARSLGPAATL